MPSERIRYHIGLAPRGTLPCDRTKRVLQRNVAGYIECGPPVMGANGVLMGCIELSNPYDLLDYHYPTERGMRQ